MSPPSRVAPGAPARVGDLEVDVAEVFTLRTPGHAAAIARSGARADLVWASRDGAWLARARDAFADPFASSLGRVVATDASGAALALASSGWSVFDDASWRALSPALAQRALASLVDGIGELHEAGFWLGGLRRRHLALNVIDGALCVGAAPRLARRDPGDVEQVWRDLRVVGELLFENGLGRPHPGPHEMAELLRDPDRLAAEGMSTPGLMQVVAGCVTPYGELAYRSAADLADGLARWGDELHEPLTLSVASRSTMGSYIFRNNNQDSCAHAVFEHHSGSRSRRTGFFCVADGIGGIQDGERASALAARAGCAAFARAWAHHGAQALEDAPVHFARAIAKTTSQQLAIAGELRPEGNRGGTTFSALLISGARAGIAHAGDSRVYLARRGQLIQLTRDHTLASILERLGELPEPGSSASSTSLRTISRFLSSGFEIELERIDGPHSGAAEALGVDEATLDVAGFPVERGDLFLLTSDGAHGDLTEDDLLGLITLHADAPGALARAIERAALDAGTRDNVTVMVVAVS